MKILNKTPQLLHLQSFEQETLIHVSAQDKLSHLSTSEDTLSHVSTSRDTLSYVSTSQDTLSLCEHFLGYIITCEHLQDTLSYVSTSQDALSCVSTSQDTLSYVSTSQDTLSHLSTSQTVISDLLHKLLPMNVFPCDGSNFKKNSPGTGSRLTFLTEHASQRYTLHVVYITLMGVFIKGKSTQIYIKIFGF